MASQERDGATTEVATSSSSRKLPGLNRKSSELGAFQMAMLKNWRKNYSTDQIMEKEEKDKQKEESHGAHHGGGGHHEKPPSILTAIPAAVINFLLMFGLSCAYGMIMFEDEWNSQHRGLAVKMNLGSALIMGLLLSTTSKVPVAIGGPDLNPVVFLGMFVTKIAEAIAADLELEYPDASKRRRLLEAPLDLIMEPGDTLRRLGSSKSYLVEFCNGNHYKVYPDQCDEYHQQLRATVIFAVSVSSLILAVVFLGLGQLKLTRYVTFVPSNIMEAFLGCVGYKVFKYALKFCKFQLRQFIPAACVGVSLYVLKASHVGNPAIVIPLMLLVPLGIFYAIVFGMGSDLEKQDDFMFPNISNVEFWKLWSESIGMPTKINFNAWTACLGELPVMIVVVVLDCLLKLSSTDNKLPIKTEKDYEMTLYGIGNFVTALCGSSVGYMQLKFNVINFGVMGNVNDRRGGIIYALLCGACFFSTIELINFLPRFFLGTLLFFAGAGFIAENLWGSRKYLSKPEWVQVCIVLGVFILLGSILYAVIVGGLLVGAGFIMKYANIPCILGMPTRGGSVFSCERRDLMVEKNMQHVADQWMMLVRLKGFLFFASAQGLIQDINMTLEKEAGDHIPRYRRLRYVIFDCKLLDSMDSSAAKACAKLVANARSREVHILWTNVTKSWADDVTPAGLVNSDNDWFESLEQAIGYIDRLILKELKFLEQKWISLDPTFELIDRLVSARRAFGPLNSILSTDAARIGCPWQYCGRMQMKKSRTILWKPDEKNIELFLICTGRVGLFADIPLKWGEGTIDSWTAPVAVYSPGWFLNREALHHKPTRLYAIALEDGELLFWNEHQYGMMSRERPDMASAIMKMVLRQEASDAERLRGVLHSRAEKLVKENSGGSVEVANDDQSGMPDCESSVPEELEQEVRGISIAKVLDDLGLYAPVVYREGSFLPPLPERLVEDLTISFFTYSSTVVGKAAVADEDRLAVRSDFQDPSKRAMEGPPQPPAKRPAAENASREAFFEPQDVHNATSPVLPRMPVAKASDALMYAGIFHSLIQEGDSDTAASLTEAEFISLGQAAAMSRLSKEQVATLETIYKKYPTRPDGTMGSETLVVLFRENIVPGLTLSDVDGVASLWYKAGKHDVTMTDFLGIMSRFIKIHEPDWFLLSGLKRLGVQDRGYTNLMNSLGSERGGGLSALTADMLSEHEGCSITQEEAQEMLWTADFCGGMGEGKALDCRLVAPALYHSEVTTCKLPPPPTIPPKDHRRKTTGVVPVVTLDDLDTNDWLVDLRNTDPKMLKEMVRQNSVVDPDCPRTGVRFTITSVSHKEEEVEGPYAKANLSLRQKIYLLMEEPESSEAANIFSLIMGILIVISVMGLVSEPLISPANEPRTEAEDAGWMAFETFFTVIFTCEIIIRTCVADAMGKSSACRYLKTPMTICDICAVVPFYVEVIIKSLGGASSNDDLRLLRIVRLMRLSRVMRVGRLANRSQVFASIATMLTVIWGIYIKTGFST